MEHDIIFLLELVAAGLFIYGIKKLSKVSTAKQGNKYAMAAMGLGVLASLITVAESTGYTTIMVVFLGLGMVLGAAAGWLVAKKVAMTAMPQMVALFNGFGGIASAIVAFSVFFSIWPMLSAHATGVDDERKAVEEARKHLGEMPTETQAQKDRKAEVVKRIDERAGRIHSAAMAGTPMNADGTFIFFLSILVGVLTFSGSMVAFAKLQEIKIAGRWLSDAISLPGGQLATVLMLAGSLVLIVLGGFVFAGPDGIFLMILILTGVSLVLGVYLTMPIGGADMPVVISLLNSYSGIAAAMAGFVVGNNLLIVGGALVGSAGLILTQIMCKAMNRSLWNVIKGGVGGAVAKDAKDYANNKSATAEDMAIDMANSESVIIVPGYGLAVSQAQHATKEMVDILKAKGVEVRFAIHPVAGRMPGHMNVLLAEADIDYDTLLEMDEINSDFKNTDVCVIIGANDVVNPAALTDPTSPLAGMPILLTHEARQVYMIKRSLAPGYAGVKNPLFECDNCRMVFGDGKQVLVEAIEALKADA